MDRAGHVSDRVEDLFALACLIGLLFLLVKEKQTTGHFEVSVRSGILYHGTQIPVSSEWQVTQTRSLVNQAQSMAASAKP